MPLVQVTYLHESKQAYCFKLDDVKEAKRPLLDDKPLMYYWAYQRKQDFAMTDFVKGRAYLCELSEYRDDKPQIIKNVYPLAIHSVSKSPTIIWSIEYFDTLSSMLTVRIDEKDYQYRVNTDKTFLQEKCEAITQGVKGELVLQSKRQWLSYSIRLDNTPIMRSPFTGWIEYVCSTEIAKQPFLVFKDETSQIIFKVQTIEFVLFGVCGFTPGERINVSLQKYPENKHEYHEEKHHFWHLTALHFPIIKAIFKKGEYACSVFSDWHSFGRINILQNYQFDALPHYYKYAAILSYPLSNNMTGALLMSKHMLLQLGYSTLKRHDTLTASLDLSSTHHSALTNSLLPVVVNKCVSPPVQTTPTTRVCELIEGRLTAKSHKAFSTANLLSFAFKDAKTNEKIYGKLSKAQFGDLAFNMQDYKITAIVNIHLSRLFLKEFLTMERLQ